MLLELSEIILTSELEWDDNPWAPVGAKKKENLATLRRQLKLQREADLNPRSINPHVLCVAQPSRQVPKGWEIINEKISPYYKARSSSYCVRIPTVFNMDMYV